MKQMGPTRAVDGREWPDHVVSRRLNLLPLFAAEALVAACCAAGVACR